MQFRWFRRLGGRSATYAQLGGIAAVLLLVGLLVPYIAGDEVDDTPLTAGDVDLPDLETDESAISTTTTSTTTTLLGSAGPQPSGVGGRTPAGPSLFSGGGAPPPAGEALTASDVGISPTTIKLGFLILDLGAISSAGFPVIVDPDQQEKAIGAFVKEINERGGIAGRQIEPHYARFDVLDSTGDSSQAACKKLTEDIKVFAVVGGFSRPEHSYCVVERNRTPMLSYIGYHPDSLYQRSQGRLVTSFPTASRMMANWVYEGEQLKVIGGKKIGIVTDNPSDPGYETEAILRGILERNGHEVAHVARFAEPASAQVPVEVQQMRTKGVEVVMMMSGTLNSQAFTQQATQQGWDPVWFTSDWSTNTADSTYSNSGESFDGAIGVTSTRNHEFRGNVPEPATATACAEVYERQTGTKLAPRGEAERSLTMHFCDMLRLFGQGATNDGPNPTRTGLIEGVQQIGDFPQSTTADASFRPGKVDGADFVRTIRYEFDCKCWEYVDGFRKTRF